MDASLSLGSSVTFSKLVSSNHMSRTQFALPTNCFRRKVPSQSQVSSVTVTRAVAVRSDQVDAPQPPKEVILKILPILCSLICFLFGFKKVMLVMDVGNIRRRRHRGTISWLRMPSSCWTRRSISTNSWWRGRDFLRRGTENRISGL